MRAPRGLGLYFYKVPTEPAAAVAARLARHGVRWAAICGPWHDGGQTKLVNTPAKLAAFSDALAARDVEPHVWGYPWHDRVGRFVEDMTRVSSAAAAGWLLDPEVGFRGRGPALRRLVREARAAIPRGPLGLTSYGNTNLSFPWGAVRGVDYGSPQLYTVGGAATARGVRAWAALGAGEVIPSFGLYAKARNGNRRKTAAELDAHLASFAAAAASTGIALRGMIGWQWRWLAAGHWPVLARWAARIESL